MSSVQLYTDRASPPPAILKTAIPAKEGRQYHRKLWSDLKEVCDLLNIQFDVSNGDREIQFQHLQFKAGQWIHANGQGCDSLCVVNSGFLKTLLMDEFGNQQVIAFPMKGDVLGVDSIYTKQQSSETVALSDGSLILLPFHKLAKFSNARGEFDNALCKIFSRELSRRKSTVSMLGASTAEARVARFLTHLSERYAEIGYSRSMYDLRMTRQEIGSFLGLSLETVSRTLSALGEAGSIDVDQRSIRINDFDMLKVRAGYHAFERSQKAAAL